ncbi:hypothetical protein BKA67DRAFT_577949 [Truncatella angustata]|uniref:Uncharacterized protein n=1 Tax=Truncatella angustata TaxID=152316 RepID=A0A9P8RQJ4_9PEZI|nr:uncharacterized protein BKA67DRAFT_577949 [Truncatella angustata]KAH6647592.1 hypothetical protein BKA67DRAFT_577949 [Truncatella angustata]
MWVSVLFSDLWFISFRFDATLGFIRRGYVEFIHTYNTDVAYYKQSRIAIETKLLSICIYIYSLFSPGVTGSLKR